MISSRSLCATSAGARTQQLFCDIGGERGAEGSLFLCWD
jgi:hypothetical protein